MATAIISLGASTVLGRFPDARFVARTEVIKIMRQQASPESLAYVLESARSRPDFQPALPSPKSYPETSLAWKATIWSVCHSGFTDAIRPLLRSIVV